jgi:hypothetical protein
MTKRYIGKAGFDLRPFRTPMGLTRPSLAIRDSVPIGQHRGDRA